MDGGGVTTILASTDVDSIALDPASDYLYWSKPAEANGAGGIFRVRRNGSGLEPIDVGSVNPGGIFITPEPATLALMIFGVLLASRVRSR